MTPRKAPTNSSSSASGGISDSRPPSISRSSSQDSAACPGATIAAVSSRARKTARHDAVEVDRGECGRGRPRLGDPFLVQRHLRRVHRSAALAEVRDLGVAHEIEASAHGVVRSYGDGGRHRRDLGRGRDDEAAAPRARPCRGLPRRARARRRRAPRTAYRRGRRIEFHVPARARPRSLRAASPAAPPASSLRSRRRPRGASPARASRRGVRPASDDRRGVRRRVAPRRALLRHGVPRRPRADGRAAAGAGRREPSAAGSARSSSTRSSRSTPPTSRRPPWRRSPVRGATTSGRSGASRSSGGSTRRASSRSSRKSARRSPSSVPEALAPTVVHGDFRLGNTMIGADAPARILAVLDWEMGALGDPRADVGYLLATYTEPGGPPSPLGTSPITARPGFPSRAGLVDRYVARSGRDVELARLVRGAGAVEGSGLLRGDLRTLRAR